MGVFSNLFIKFKMGVLCWEEGNATLVEHDGEKPDDYDEIMKQVKEVLTEQLRQVQEMPQEALLTRRFDRIMDYGQFVEK